MDKYSFQAKCGLTEQSLEYEIAEQWLDKYVEPQMIEVAKNQGFSYDFIVNTNEMDPDVIRKVLNIKGYGVLSWPVVHQVGSFVKQVRIRILW